MAKLLLNNNARTTAMAKDAASTSTPCLSKRAAGCFPESCVRVSAADKPVLSAQHQLRPDIEVDFETLHFVNMKTTAGERRISL
jgi:hypothetical protein